MEPSAADPDAPADPIKRVTLKGLPDAIDEAVYSAEKWPLILDPTGDASRFLKYQRGSFLLGFNPHDMEADKLRQLLVGALNVGSNMVIKYRTIENQADLTKHFVPGCFPEEILVKSKILDQACWETLLRPEQGDKQPHEFMAMDAFCLMVVTETEEFPPECLEFFQPILVGESKTTSVDANGNAEDSVGAMFGAKEIKKNSKDLVEAGFDGELDEIKALVDKGYHIDSEDGRGHTALSEAASQGHNHVIEWLLKQGADPNLGNDNNRTPMYRAAFNGHAETIQFLLESGGDREQTDKSNGEKPFDVAKDDATRAVISEWDYTRTEALMEERAAQIRKKLEERIVTAADREALARQLITEELCAKTEKGDCDGVRELLMEQADEADRTNRRPLVTCEARTARGQTLLSLACQFGHIDIVTMLCEHHKHCDDENFALDPGQHSWEYRVFHANVNSKENKGWNCAAIATFHEQKAALAMLLENGADPTIKNSYRKSALDLSQDDLDAAMNVVKDKSEIRRVLEAWDNSQGSKLFGTGKQGVQNNIVEVDALPDEGTGVAMQVEIAKEGGLVKGGKGGGGGGKGGGGAKKKVGNAVRKISNASAATKGKKKK
jgi:ankyrin repeat protein